MRRSTPGAGLGTQSCLAAWTITGTDSSALMRMTPLLYGQDHSELDLAGFHFLVGFECLLQRHRLDLRSHARQHTEIECPLVLIGRTGDRTDDTTLAADKVAGRYGQRVFTNTEQNEPSARCEGGDQR